MSIDLSSPLTQTLNRQHFDMLDKIAKTLIALETQGIRVRALCIAGLPSLTLEHDVFQRLFAGQTVTVEAFGDFDHRRLTVDGIEYRSCVRREPAREEVL